MAIEKPGRVAEDHGEKQSSHGEHGGNRGGRHDENEERKQSDPAAGKNPHRSNRR